MTVRFRGVFIMDKRTRVLNAMDCKPVDRVPVTFYTHFLSEEAQRDNAVAAQVKWMRDCGMDCLCVETDGYMEYPLENTVGSLNDWKNLHTLKKDSPYFMGQLDRAKRIAEAAEDACIFYMLFTPYSVIKHTIGGESKIGEFFKADKNVIIDAMKVIEESNFLLADMLKQETDITGYFVSLQNAEASRFTIAEYNEYLAEWDIRLLNYVNQLSDYNITHMCSWAGECNQLELWKEYPYKTVNWSVNIEKDMDFKKARDYFKPGSCLMAGFDNTPNGILYRGSKEEIKEHTKKQLELAGTIGTILCGDCSLQMDQNPTNVKYVIEACEEYAASQN